MYIYIYIYIYIYVYIYTADSESSAPTQAQAQGGNALWPPPGEGGIPEGIRPVEVSHFSLSRSLFLSHTHFSLSLSHTHTLLSLSRALSLILTLPNGGEQSALFLADWSPALADTERVLGFVCQRACWTL